MIFKKFLKIQKEKQIFLRIGNESKIRSPHSSKGKLKEKNINHNHDYGIISKPKILNSKKCIFDLYFKNLRSFSKKSNNSSFNSFHSFDENFENFIGLGGGEISFDSPIIKQKEFNKMESSGKFIINQSIPFKLKTLYSNKLEAKKNLDFQPKESSNNKRDFLKIYSNSGNSPSSSKSILFIEHKVISIKNLVINENNVKLQFKNEKTIKNIANVLFNYKPLLGISFLISFNYIQINPKSIANFLCENDCFSINKSPIKLGKFLTNLKLKEVLDIVKFFTESFNFLGESKNFIASLREFLSQIVLPNDPEKIDILLYAFARKYHSGLKKQIKLSLFFYLL